MTHAVQRNATILLGATLSNTIDCSRSILASITLPAAMTGATLTLNNIIGATAYGVNSTSATAYSITTTGNLGKTLPIDLNVARSLLSVQLVSASAEAADRTIILNFREGDSAI